jgi:glyoxylase-like metal-dependent hydrolase (beta-lactamase superfamily II)
MTQVSQVQAVDRRQFLTLSAGAAASGFLPRHAQASMAHKFKHGEFDVTVLSDGFLTLPAEVLLPDASPDERAPILAAMGGNATGANVQANVPLLRRGNDLILVDIGAGSHFQASTGRLLENLKAAGVDPADVTKVILTHAHPDHSGAMTTAQGRLLYPNARYYVSGSEWDFWTDPSFELRRPTVLHEFAKGAQRDLLAVRDRVTMVKEGDEIASGISIVATPGHTPGHVSVEVKGRDNLLITGDACTSDIIFFAHPGWHFGFDTEGEAALASRRKLLDRAASEKLKLLGYHWTYPGLGYAERAGDAYRFRPVEA